MMSLFKNTIFLKYLKNIDNVYSTTEEKIAFIYSESLSYQLNRIIFVSVRNIFKFSIFDRLIQIDKYASGDFLKESKILRLFLGALQKLSGKATECFARSSFFVSTVNLKSDFLLRPLKVAGTIVIIAITTELFLLIILQRQIVLLGWITRVSLLFIGIGGLFCNANTNWQELRNSSFFIRCINVSCKV